jgi:hypothetical protein
MVVCGRRARRRATARVFLGIAFGGAYAVAVATAGAADLPEASAPRPPIRVEDECPLAPLDEVLAVLRVEVPARLVEGSPRGAVYEIAVECAADRVLLHVAAPARPTQTFRTSLADVPSNVRARIVALAIAEIVRDLDREGAEAAAARPAPPALEAHRPAVARLRPTPDRPTPRAQLAALAQASNFQLDGRWLAGGGLRFEYSSAEACAGIDAVLLGTDRRFDFGTTQTLLSYASPYAGFLGVAGPVRVRVGGGFAFGVARLSGRASDPSFSSGTLAGYWTAPYAFLAAALAIGDGLRLDLRVQAGWVTSPVIGEVVGGAVAAGGDARVEGLWTSTQIGFALAL